MSHSTAIDNIENYLKSLTNKDGRDMQSIALHAFGDANLTSEVSYFLSSMITKKIVKIRNGEVFLVSQSLF